MPSFENLSGRRFHRLLVLDNHERRTVPSSRGVSTAVFWECRCDCGTVLFVRPYSLKNGNTKSCGCLNFEERKRPKTHGKSKTRTYRIWQRIKQRCYYPNSRDFHRWGGRGIVMCEEWKNSFQSFLQDMGECPSSKHSIDRIDNDGPYCRENCRWATRQVQCRNTQRNRLLTMDGVTKTLVEWSETTGIASSTIRQRLDYYNWSIQAALSTPVAS